jgi:hypothetical protein
VCASLFEQDAYHPCSDRWNGERKNSLKTVDWTDALPVSSVAGFALAFVGDGPTLRLRGPAGLSHVPSRCTLDGGWSSRRAAIFSRDGRDSLPTNHCLHRGGLSPRFAQSLPRQRLLPDLLPISAGCHAGVATTHGIASAIATQAPGAAKRRRTARLICASFGASLGTSTSRNLSRRSLRIAS